MFVTNATSDLTSRIMERHAANQLLDRTMGPATARYPKLIDQAMGPANMVAKQQKMFDLATGPANRYQKLIDQAAGSGQDRYQKLIDLAVGPGNARYQKLVDQAMGPASAADFQKIIDTAIGKPEVVGFEIVTGSQRPFVRTISAPTLPVAHEVERSTWTEEKADAEVIFSVASDVAIEAEAEPGKPAIDPATLALVWYLMGQLHSKGEDRWWRDEDLQFIVQLVAGGGQIALWALWLAHNLS